MGLSASQTRYLSLTARKSNVEYQGQQINQARTALANQSSDLYTELMSLKAPTAPSVYKYVIEPPVTPQINWADDTSYPLEGEALKNFCVYYAGNVPSFRDFNIPEYAYCEEKDAAGNITNYGYRLKTYDEKGVAKYSGDYLRQSEIKGTYFVNEEGFDINGNKMNYNRVYVSPNANYTYNIESGNFEPKAGVDAKDMHKWIQAYNAAMNMYQTYSNPTKKAIFTQTPPSGAVDPQADGYAYSAQTNINQAQYNAAMEQYEKDLKEYEETCDQINAKTEEIHEADKKLELQLKQLDTEQEAIQTEYEAVKKVIDKNIENTFKSFA